MDFIKLRKKWNVDLGELHMKYTCNKTLPKWERGQIPIWLAQAEDFLRKRYPHVDYFDQLDLNFSKTRRGSLYYPGDNAIKIGIHAKLLLYKRKTCTHYAPEGGLSVGEAINTICGIIHECTHAIQKAENRVASEVETTQNEIDFLKEKYPYWFNQLIPNSAD